jgi:protease-4
MPPHGRRGRRILFAVLVALLAVSVIVNVELLAVAAMGLEGLSQDVLQDGDKDQTIAVYRLSGIIDQEAVRGFERFARMVHDTPRIKAVVVRVDSPGGEVCSSDEIHRLMLAIRRQRHVPLAVSMGGVAASGGYYVSAPADLIYAEPTTITGSIGVIAVWPVLEGLLDKAGVRVIAIRSTDARVWKARQNFWETPDQMVLQNLQEMLDRMQDQFEQIVRQGRGSRLVLRPQSLQVPNEQGQPQTVQVTAPFDGQVYLGRQAMDLGLVDRIGYLSDASTAAAELAKLDKPRVVEYSRQKGLLEHLAMGRHSAIDLAPQHLAKLASPQVMMLWRP